MNAPWKALQDEIKRSQDGGRPVEFWWRDDDAARPEPALARLLALRERVAVPLALAVIPAYAERAALGALPSGVSVLQHGSDHRSRAAEGQKKSEYAENEPAAAPIGRLAAARQKLALALGDSGARLLPVLAPPWNRLPASLAAPLAAAGYRGLSRFGPRQVLEAAPGLRQVNTHVDLIAWHAGRGFAGEEAVLGAATRHLAAKREGRADADEATGWLSHHLVHDEPAWNFLERLFERVPAAPGLRWLGAQALFHVA